MKNFAVIFIVLLAFSSCQEKKPMKSVLEENWSKRTIKSPLPGSLVTGTTYLSVYSQIYGMTEHRLHDLSSTISMRNTSRKDTVYITSAEYFDTEGDLLRSYFDKPIYILPMETVEILIDKKDQAGGTGANLVFQWNIKDGSSEPLFEGVMISTTGQQGISFTTQGVRIN